MHRITIEAVSINVESFGYKTLNVDIDIEESKTQDVLDNFDVKDIIENLHRAERINADLFLYYNTLEDLFDKFTPSELKTRLAKYLIDM